MAKRPGRIATLLSVCVLVAACSPSTSPTPVPSGATTTGPDSTLVATPTPPALPATSEQLIAAALAAGSITSEQSLLYRALALYNSPGLPAQFKSPVADMHAAGTLFAEIDAKKATLSAEVLAKLAPYMVRPSDPTSIFNVPAATGAPAAAIGLTAAATPVWKSQTAAGGKARVWVVDSPTAAADLATHAADVDLVWNAYPGIFTYPRADQPNLPAAAVNPDGAIDFYFVNVGTLDPRRPECEKTPSLSFCVYTSANAGYAQRTDKYLGYTSSGYLVIDASAHGDTLLDTMAHELAHASQYAYDVAETSWLYESTATWVAYKVMIKIGHTPDAYAWLWDFYNGLDQTLTRETKENAYGSWLFFLYASMEKGDGVVTDIWKAAAVDGVQGEKAVDKVFPFAKNFAGFSVRDWNQEPVKPRYKAADTKLDGYRPSPRNSVEHMAGGKEDSLDVTLPPLASAYFEHSFDGTARAVNFTNSLAGTQNAHVWAIATIKGVDKAPEDWTARPKAKFCRDIPDQDLTKVVIIVSNSSLTDKLTVSEPPKVVADAKGCTGWSGTMTGSEWWSKGNASSVFTGVWVSDETGDAHCNQGSTDCTLYRPIGTINWTRESHYDGKCDATVSGTVVADTESHDDQQNFYTRVVDDTHLEYWGRGYFEAPPNGCINQITIGSTAPSFFDIYSGSSATRQDDGTGDSCAYSTWQIDAKADTISGSCYAYKNNNTWMKYEWNLKRIGQAPGA